MGQSIDRPDFSARDFEHFERSLRDQLEQLKGLLEKPGFGRGARTLGAEVELCLIDQHNRPLCQNQAICDALPGSGLALEINQYNLELNLPPQACQGRPFSELESIITERMGQIDALLGEGNESLAIGILPTLTRDDFGPQVMTQEPRYDALSRMLRAQRGDRFQIALEGEQNLSFESDDVTIEGANTSTQIHLRVDPDEFAHWFNAFQLITPLALGLSTNAPLLFGKRLWHETRVPLFRQSIDGRSALECQRAIPSRVDFGSGWVRSGVYELFAEQVNLHPPLLPLCQETATSTGPAPELPELRLHSGTVWPWNRAVYDPKGEGHVRIELRALPAGPTPVDMMANAAFMIGLGASFKDEIEQWIHRMPFETLSNDFYTAAQEGMDSRLYWPKSDGGAGLELIPIRDLGRALLSRAETGLQQLGMDAAEVERYLSVIEHRVDVGQSGSHWILNADQKLLARGVQESSVRMNQLTQQYRQQSKTNTPVSQWQPLEL